LRGSAEVASIPIEARGSTITAFDSEVVSYPGSGIDFGPGPKIYRGSLIYLS
jgi:hypothetical protein